MGIQMEALQGIENDDALPFSSNEEGVQEILDLRKVNEDMKNRIEALQQEINAYEQEKATENIGLKNLKDQVDEYKMLAGHEKAIGTGVIITLESSFDENIAELVERKKYLINLINELTMFGAEVISINNHRITARSEVTLAGDHINVNAKPIAPPYIIRGIGDVEGFKRYINFRTVLFELMQLDGINSYVEFSDEVKIPAVTREKPMQFLQVKESTS